MAAPPPPYHQLACSDIFGQNSQGVGLKALGMLTALIALKSISEGCCQNASRYGNQTAQSLINDDDIDERLILATGRYIGEGFDDPRLDTLFLVMPVSWRGTLAQYVGRLHREHDGKSDVIVYDYVDVEVSVLAKMATKRQAGYRGLGYDITTDKAGCPRLL